MSSELSPSSGDFSFVSRGLVRAIALARMAASSASRSSVVSVSAGGAMDVKDIYEKLREPVFEAEP